MTATTDRFAKQAMEVSKELQELGVIAKEAAQEKLGQLRDGATGYYGQGREKVHDAVSSCEQFVRQRPFGSMLIAAGIGLLLGRFWMRR
jgi:ElaB/YqjD/DUF883 family membrane-anchored ribosome-binding protein